MRKSQAGFTLVELLVVAAIVTIISAVILANNNRFGGRVQLQNLAYDIALTIRQAQVYGISVRGSSGGAFNVGYGVHFNKSQLPSSYIIFADTNGNGAYDDSSTGAPDQVVQTVSMASGFSIDHICAGTLTTCTTLNSNTSLDIIFVRPEPDAWINATCTTVGNPNEHCSGGVQQGQIFVRPPKILSAADLKAIVVTLSGQIRVQ